MAKGSRRNGENSRFYCDLCSFRAVELAEWNSHLKTKLHHRRSTFNERLQTGTQPKLCCQICMFIFPMQWHLDAHMRSRKHAGMLGRKIQEDIRTHGTLQNNKAGLVVTVPNIISDLMPKQRTQVD
ncbi:hypothetical protein CEUSTIGMA_g11550.t1 [Chlamydomonas eustigma]|uniref:C2H2-type domain-containing protein n=1 Tax=Chlamydomonas eustigma TaxID=1157962 RepID=A0A250XM30_9CHLO|nr:hypothetical protein CEUSTIGMA_g11550.t1 [Chlamydomonas eustigma]|eukprot:GAX84127.1 hypothetical protein CEUSTIGMA_g11550.t1 [Chlamydomonas eustigma]